MKRAVASLALACGLAAAPAAADLADALAPGSRVAPGVGGDPFASPLENRDGWWSLPGPDRGGSEGASFRSSRPFAAGATGIELRRTEWRGYASQVLPIGTRTLRLAVARGEPAWNTSVGARPVSARGAGARAGIGIATRLDRVLPGLALAGSFPAWSDSRQPDATPLGIGARFEAPGWIAAQGSWTRTREAQGIHVLAGTEAVAARADLRFDLASADLRAFGGSPLAAEVAMRRLRVAPRSAAAKLPGYGLGMDADATLWQSGVVLQAAEPLRLLLRNTVGRGTAEADARFEGQRFGRVSYLRGHVDSWLAGAEWSAGRRRWLGDVEHLDAGLGGRGTLESWPFTSLLVDLLGLRKNVLASAEVGGWRAHAGAELGTAGDTRWRIGAHAWDLETDAWMITWQPSFLVFGVSGRERTALDVHRVQLGAVSFGSTFRLGPLEVAADARQFVFAKAFRGARASGAGAGSSPAEPAAAAPESGRSHGRRWPGGTTIELALRRAW